MILKTVELFGSPLKKKKYISQKWCAENLHKKCSLKNVVIWPIPPQNFWSRYNCKFTVEFSRSMQLQIYCRIFEADKFTKLLQFTNCRSFAVVSTKKFCCGIDQIIAVFQLFLAGIFSSSINWISWFVIVLE